MKSPPDRYSMVAIILHWTIAVLILTNVGIAWWADDVRGPDRVAALQPHKVIGITVLLLTFARLAWRLAMKPPRMPDTMAAWERGLARTVHVLFYVVMVALPLSGWAMVSASSLASTSLRPLSTTTTWSSSGPSASPGRRGPLRMFE